MKPPPLIVNVGLPRTGTNSFAGAVELLGLKSLHVWHEAEHDPRVLAEVKTNHRKSRRFLAKYHALCDTPFYALRETFERFYPDALILYTTRAKADWIRSMVNTYAGGRFLAAMYGLRGPPYSVADAHDLGRLFDEHHTKVCRALPSIDIGDGDGDHRRKWELLCSALPNPVKAMARVSHLDWPHENRSPEGDKPPLDYGFSAKS